MGSFHHRDKLILMVNKANSYMYQAVNLSGHFTVKLKRLINKFFVKN